MEIVEVTVCLLLVYVLATSKVISGRIQVTTWPINFEKHAKIITDSTRLTQYAMVCDMNCLINAQCQSLLRRMIPFLFT